MADKRDYERLGDIVRAAYKILQFTSAMDRTAFNSDERTQYAVIALFEIIG